LLIALSKKTVFSQSVSSASTMMVLRAIETPSLRPRSNLAVRAEIREGIFSRMVTTLNR
jgi:hypothetical protein